MRVSPILTMLLLPACTIQMGRQASYVGPLSQEAAAQAAYDITGFVSHQIRPEDGAIAVTQPPGDTMLFPELTDNLRTAGYTVTEGTRMAKHHLRFSVSAMPDGTFLHATLDAASIAQLYHQDANQILRPSGPATILSLSGEVTE